MQLNQTTDYAVRIVVYLAQQELSKAKTTSDVISDAVGASKAYVSRLCIKLKNEKIIAYDREYGYRLVKRPEQITMLRIITAVEPTIKLNRCLEADRFCNGFGPDVCPVHYMYQQMQDKLEGFLGCITIADIISDDYKEQISHKMKLQSEAI